MKRRSFMKQLLTASLLSPLIQNVNLRDRENEIYIISDNPQTFIIPLLEELQSRSLIKGQGYWLNPSHPQGDELRRALADWMGITTASHADVSVTYRFLQSSSRPSFTLVQNGRIMDIRKNRLGSLWKSMHSGIPSRIITVVSFQKERVEYQPGTFVSLFAGGQKIDKISLNSVLTRSYAVKGGKVTVRIEEGLARVEDSPCLHKICMATLPISYAGERILCAPNRFLMKIEGRRFLDTIIG